MGEIPRGVDLFLCEKLKSAIWNRCGGARRKKVLRADDRRINKQALISIARMHLPEEIAQKVHDVSELYHRLVLVVGPAGSGKTAAMREVSRFQGFDYINLNLELSRLLLGLTERQRSLQLPDLIDGITEKGKNSVILLDNIEILFEVSLKQDPLRLLQGMSRNRTIAASWNGRIKKDYLIYAEPEHREYRRYPLTDLMVIDVEKKA